MAGGCLPYTGESVSLAARFQMFGNATFDVVKRSAKDIRPKRGKNIGHDCLHLAADAVEVFLTLILDLLPRSLCGWRKFVHMFQEQSKSPNLLVA